MWPRMIEPGWLMHNLGRPCHNPKVGHVSLIVESYCTYMYSNYFWIIQGMRLRTSILNSQLINLNEKVCYTQKQVTVTSFCIVMASYILDWEIIHDGLFRCVRDILFLHKIKHIMNVFIFISFYLLYFP